MSELLERISGLRAAVLESPAPAGDDPSTDRERVELITQIELLKSALCATQADLAVGLDTSVRTQRETAGVPRERAGRGVASQIGLARQESPHRGQQLLGFAKDLARDLPATRQALREGRINEYRATLIARETGCLDTDDRRRVDTEICDPAVLDGLGNQQLTAQVRRRVAQLDPAAVLRRHQRAVGDRTVTVRPAPDGMAYLTGFLPLTQAVAAYAALKKTADTMIGTGDNTDPADPAGKPRSRGQLMADLMVEWLTGQKHADSIPITLTLVMSDATLLGAGHEPATIPGHGPVPAQVAREAVARATETTQAWIRKLYTNASGDLVALTTQQRLATDGLAAYLAARDQGICRTPWCDAPTRHLDHVLPHEHNGTTDVENLQGLCEACNHAKQAPGWRQRTIHGETQLYGQRHTVHSTTPTGHTYSSRAPAPPGVAEPPLSESPWTEATHYLAPEVDAALQAALDDILVRLPAAS
ncbi:HNH endonuclease [Nocardioides nanhaiensis]|uniref:HNH endonuclease signature motif containing protein n=1 Tax=Nocardioides nanhaiensis TaxID=1476871 RepID=A0ABP8WZ73_9ACTN